MNLVERFFADLTAGVVREGSFASLREWVTDIEQYPARRNANPRTYGSLSEGQAILAKIRRARQKLAQVATD